MPKQPSNLEFITRQEATAWLRDKDLGVLENDRPARPVGQHWKIFEVPKQPRLQTTLAWHLVKLLPNKPGMLLLTDWPIYTESEMQTFVEGRKQHAEHRSLIEVPGCLFKTLDVESERFLVHTISLMFAFNFEGFLFAEDKCVIIWLADEIIELAWSTDDITTKLQRALEELHILPLKQSSFISSPNL